MGLNLAHGGHLSHGSPVNISGKYFNVVPYHLNSETEMLEHGQEPNNSCRRQSHNSNNVWCQYLVSVINPTLKSGPNEKRKQYSQGKTQKQIPHVSVTPSIF
jgi:hypothetical protein